MTRYLADTETNGLLDDATKVHSLVLEDIDTGDVLSCANHAVPGVSQFYPPIEAGLDALAKADLVVGHNWIKFDAPVLDKIYRFKMDETIVEDSLIMSRLMYPEIGNADTRLIKEGTLPGRMWGRHGLEAWGHRLGLHKGDYAKTMKEKDIDPWADWSPDMQDYCERDVKVLGELRKRYRLLVKKLIAEGNDPARCIEIEHQIVWVMAQQERNGFPFDVKRAGDLYSKIVGQRETLEHNLDNLFKPWWVKTSTETVGKTRNVKMTGQPDVTIPRTSEKTGKELSPYVGPPLCEYEEGAVYSKIKYTKFNPNSRPHIADRLTALHGWEPSDFTKTGLPQVDDEILVKLAYPEAKELAKYFLLDKRVGQIAEGKQAWLKVEKKGKIHGTVNTNAAVTGRATHSGPNVGQVPSVRVPFGKECRECFHVDPAWGVLLGSDQDALELRCLAGFMSLWDNGAYIETVLRGDKKVGTDIHSVNARALGLDPVKRYPVGGKQQTGRDLAKTWFYAFIYGAGNLKLGKILGETKKSLQVKRGKVSRARFLKELPALGALIEAVKEVVNDKGYLLGLDGRKLHIRSLHSALNTLLQSAGALLCKVWVILIERKCREAGLKHGWDGDYAFCAWVHDEVQIAVREKHIETLTRICKEAAVEAGEFFEFACPTEADASTGRTWAETH
jgi:DNA polymerase I-like protein with 3'-5' exonuclease and polymerase domains